MGHYPTNIRFRKTERNKTVKKSHSGTIFLKIAAPEVIKKVIHKKSKIQLQRVVKGKLRLLTKAATADKRSFCKSKQMRFVIFEVF